MQSRPVPIADRRETSGSAARPWLSRVLGREARATAVNDAASADAADPLAAFSNEPRHTAAPAARPLVVRVPSARAWSPLMIAAAAVLGVAFVFVAYMQYRAIAARNAASELGKLTIDSRPQGTKVIIDGEERGVTPLTVSLKPGDHGLALLNGAERRSLPVTIVAGATASQYFEFAPTAPVVNTGRLSITGDVPGSRVTIDGRLRGATPLLISDLPAGEHTVVVTSEGGSLERKVMIEAGTTASIVFSAPKNAGPAAGWVSVAAPFDVQLFEGADLIGTGASSKIMLPTGRHDIRVVSERLGYEDTKRVEVAPGKVSAIRIEAPKATVSANARPWADVIIDGTTVGQTPLANLSIAIGSHEVIFRHPQLGEQRQTVVVTSRGPNRISADLTKK